MRVFTADMVSSERDRVPRGILTAAALVIIIAGLKLAAHILVPLVFAGFLAALTAPLVLWLRERRVPLGASIPLVVVGLLGVLFAFAAVLAESVRALVTSWPRYAARFATLTAEHDAWLEAHGLDFVADHVSSVVGPEALIALATDVGLRLGELSTNIGIVILVLVFLLLEVVGLPAKLRLALGDPNADLGRYERITTEVRRYLVIKTWLSLATGAFVWVMLAVLGVDFALLWGVVAFVLNYIPNVGAFIAAAPTILLALVQYDLGVATIVAGGHFAVHMVVGNTIEPWLMGKKLGLSAFVVFATLMFWGWVWGPTGMLLAVPLTMVLKIAAEHSPEWRWVSVLMDPAPEPPARASRAPAVNPTEDTAE